MYLDFCQVLQCLVLDHHLIVFLKVSLTGAFAGKLCGVFRQNIADSGKVQIRAVLTLDDQIILPRAGLFVEAVNTGIDTFHCPGCLADAVQAVKTENAAAADSASTLFGSFAAL